ncbi:growth-regulating factor 3-like [Rutidosis leptorrhynchoides]|uniref:growth-regulating factor 3-like n=1 Tax=Rutidosis leptorrhynchoides TaxID=125765 RepID=UPI003A9A233F
MDFHLHHREDSSSSSSLALPLFSSEPTSSSSTKSSKEMMQGVSGYFSLGQWQELEIQALIYRHMLTGSPIPQQLLHLLLNSSSSNSITNTNSTFYPLSNFPPLYQSTGGGYWGRGGMDLEPGRCRRTDGKKWRCSKDVVVGHKYCDKHVHRGRNRSRKPVEVPTPTTTANHSSTRGSQPFATLTSGTGGSGHSPFFDQPHLNQRLTNISENDNRSSSGRVLRPFFDDWPRTVQEHEMLATSLSISVPGDTPSDFSLKLSTGNNETGQRGEQIIGERERGPSNWGMLWGTHHAGSMGGPLAEALRSSSTSNTSSPTSVLHQLQRGSTTTSETSYVST